MRILVGTLYSGEHEFDRCVEAVRNQRHACAEHLIIRGLPLRDAADQLFARFFSSREFDLLVKVDADMVLTHDGIFEGIVSRFQDEPGLQLLSIGVQDFYTDQMIGSLNAYRNTIPWEPCPDRLAPDRVVVPKDRRANDDRTLAPAAWHCPDPWPVQAFHFGLHRGAKTYAAARLRDMQQLKAQLGMLDKTLRTYRRRADRRLLLAVLGGELAMTGRFGAQFVSYQDPAVVAAFGPYEHAPVAELEAAVVRLRRGNWGFVPPALRIEMLRPDWITLPFRLLVPYSLRKAASKAVAKRWRRVAKWSRRTFAWRY